MKGFDLYRCAKASISYVPVIHRSLLDFFRAQEAPVLVLGSDLIAEYPQLEHDLRAVSSDEAVSMLTGLGLLARSISRDDLSDFLSMNDSTVFSLPQDEVMIDFANRYLVGRVCEFHQVFTRWHKINATSEEEVGIDRTISHQEFDRDIVIQCSNLAQLSSDWWRQVGAMAIRDGKVLATGVNRHLPTDYTPYIDGDIRQCFGFGECIDICGAIHAEAAVVAVAAKDGISLAGVDLYVTTFPCPSCARLISKTGVRRVFYRDGYSVCDANDILSGQGIEIIKVEP